MPFMLFHPAAAIPFYRPLGRYGVLSALIIGSLMPDMHYFLPLAVERGAAHSVQGLVWFCWPLGFGFYFLYHRLLKRPLALLLPPAFAARVAPWLGQLPPVSLRAVALSLLLGAATHIAWDAFTHRHGAMVEALPVLRSVWFTLGNYPLPGYEILQQASNVLGFTLLSIWLRRWSRTAAAPGIVAVDRALPPLQRRFILSSVLIVSITAAALVVRDTVASPTDLVALHSAFKQATLTAMSSSALALLAYSLLWHLHTKRRRVVTLQS